MQKQTPIQAFFNQANGTNTNWWTWLAVFWFAVMLWFYGQLIFGIPLAVVGMIVDPSSLDAMMEAQNGDGAAQRAGYLMGMGTLIFGLLAALLVYILRNNSSEQAGKRNIQIATLFVALSFFALIYFIKTGLGTIIIGSLAAFLFYILRNKPSEQASKRSIQIASVFGALSFFALIYFIKTGSSSDDAAMLNGWIAKSALVYMFMLMMFPPMALGLWLGVKHVQKRTILSLHTAHFKFRWGRMVFAMLVVWAIAAISSFGAHATGLSEATLVFDSSRFWKYLPITLLFIPLQSATEEIALRGYLNQGLGKYIKNPWIVFIITSAAFASLHLSNPEVAETVKEHSIWVAMSGYFFFGLFACVLTYIDGGLEAAIGMHAANNMFAAAIVGYDNSALPVPTIFKVGLNTQLDSIMVVVSLALVCLIMYVTRKPLILPEPAEGTEAGVFS